MRQMKHQFKYNPLATAILTLLCGSSISSYAAENDSSNSNNQQLKQSLQETYPGEAFFSQYYVDKSTPEAQQRQGQYLSSAYCQGTWITRFHLKLKQLLQIKQPLLLLLTMPL